MEFNINISIAAPSGPNGSTVFDGLSLNPSTPQVTHAWST